MRLSRTIAGLVSAGLLGVTPLALASPANATENLTATVTLDSYNINEVVTYGDDLRVTGAVLDQTGGSVYDGTVTLYAMTPGSTWTAVETVDASGYLSFSSIKATSNVAFKAVYSGWTATSTYEDNVTPAESAPMSMAVKRKANLRTKGLWLMGKIKPDFKKKKVILKRKKGKKYVPWKKVRTNKKGAFRVKAPNKRGFKFTLTVPSDAKFTGFTAPYHVV